MKFTTKDYNQMAQVLYDSVYDPWTDDSTIESIINDIKTKPTEVIYGLCNRVSELEIDADIEESYFKFKTKAGKTGIVKAFNIKDAISKIESNYENDCVLEIKMSCINNDIIEF